MPLHVVGGIRQTELAVANPVLPRLGRGIRRAARRLAEPLPGSEASAMRQLYQAIHADTPALTARILDAARHASSNNGHPSGGNQLLEQGLDLRDDLRRQYGNALAGDTPLRIAVQVPPPGFAPGTASLFTNLLDGLNAIGVPAFAMHWGESTDAFLAEKRPSVLMLTDDTNFLAQIDWRLLGQYKRTSGLAVGLQAALQSEDAGPLRPRLDRALRLGIDWFFSYNSPEYHATHFGEYQQTGLQLISVEFGANPDVYRPLRDITRTAPFVFLGSTHDRKRTRYVQYFSGVLSEHPGILIGRGWPAVPDWVDRKDHSFLYASARAALNLHNASQVEEPSQLNERTYNLAAAGVPQIVDPAALLEHRFRVAGFWVARTPEDYLQALRQASLDPDLAQAKAMIAQNDALTRHSIYARASLLASSLLSAFPEGGREAR